MQVSSEKNLDIMLKDTKDITKWKKDTVVLLDSKAQHDKDVNSHNMNL